MEYKSNSYTYFNVHIEQRLSDGLLKDSVKVLGMFYDLGTLSLSELKFRIDPSELNTRGDSYGFLIDELRGSKYLKGSLDGKLEITEEGRIYVEKVRARPKKEIISFDDKKEGKLEAIVKKKELVTA